MPARFITKLGLLITIIFAGLALSRVFASAGGSLRFDRLPPQAQYRPAHTPAAEREKAPSPRPEPEKPKNDAQALLPGFVETTITERPETVLSNLRYMRSPLVLSAVERRRKGARKASSKRPSTDKSADTAVLAALDEAGKARTYRLESGLWQSNAPAPADPQPLSDPSRSPGLVRREPVSTGGPYDSKIPRGYRSVEVPVPLRGDIMEFTKPQRRVDVVWIHATAEGRRSAETILRQVRVSGVGIVPGQTRNIVNLLLSEPDAQKVEKAQVDGKLELLLVKCIKDCSAVPPALPESGLARVVEEPPPVKTAEAAPAAFELSLSTQSFEEALAALPERRFPAPESVRIEELINAAAGPAVPPGGDEKTFSITVEAAAPEPKLPADVLVMLTIRARDFAQEVAAFDPFLAIEFNPAAVSEYRLVGYDYRPTSEWEVDEARSVKPGTIAIVLFGVKLTDRAEHELGFIKLLFRSAEEDLTKLISGALTREALRAEYRQASLPFKLALAGGCAGQLLRHSRYRFTCPPDLTELVRNDARFNSVARGADVVSLLEAAKLDDALREKLSAR